MAIKKIQAVILLERSALYYFAEGFPSAIVCQFPAELIRDLEVINKKEFGDYLQSFIDTNQLQPAMITLLLSDSVIFEKDILAKSADTEQSIQKNEISAQVQDIQESEVKKFIDTVPFENVITHIYRQQEGIKIVATNNDLPTVIKDAFEQRQSTITAVIPAALVGDTIANGLNNETLTMISSQFDAIKTQSLIQVYQNIVDTPSAANEQTASPKQIKNKRLYVLIGVMGVLFLIMSIMLVQSFAPIPPRQLAPVPQQLPINTPIPTTIPADRAAIPANTIVTAVPTAAIDLSTITIQIVDPNPAGTNAQNIKAKLMNNGFSNISINNQSGTGTTKILVILSATLPPVVQTKINDVLKTALVSYTTQVNNQSRFGVTIIFPSSQ